MGIKHCGKRRNYSLRATSPFLTVFSKDLYCRHVKTRACLGNGYNKKSLERKQIQIKLTILDLNPEHSMPN